MSAKSAPLAAALSLVVLAAAAAASAQGTAQPVRLGEVASGYVYYNRPGSTPTEHNQEFAECARDTYMYIAPPGQGVVSAFVWSGPIQGAAAIQVENCMIVRGWRVYRLPEAEGEALTRLGTGTQFTSRIDPWIGSETPPGEQVRSWENHAMHPAAYRLPSRPPAPGRDHLAFRYFADSGVKALEANAEATPANGPIPQALRFPNLPAPGPGKAVIVAHIRGIGPRWGLGVSFVQETAPGATPPGPAFAGTGYLSAKREGNWFAFEVPAGRWRIGGSGFLTYCMGSPSFEARSGEVVYAGSFNIAGQDLGPDMSLEAPRAKIQGEAASLIRPAVYENGSRGSCRSYTTIYALEFPGAPFREGYEWGSARASQ